MHKIAAPLLFLLLGCSAVRAQERRVEFSIGPILVDFSLPAGFERMSAEEVAAEFPRGGPRLVVFRQPRSGLLVTVNVFDADGQGIGDVRSLKKRLESDFAAADPTARWLSRGVVKLGGDDWVRLRYKTAAGTGKVISETYATLWAGEAVVVTFHGPAAEYEGRRAAFRKSAQSIKLSVLVNAPAGDAPPGRP